jgi:hypothetical protein
MMPAISKAAPESQKEEVLHAMRQVREKILAAAAALPPEKQKTIFDCTGFTKKRSTRKEAVRIGMGHAKGSDKWRTNC